MTGLPIVVDVFTIAVGSVAFGFGLKCRNEPPWICRRVGWMIKKGGHATFQCEHAPITSPAIRVTIEKLLTSTKDQR